MSDVAGASNGLDRTLARLERAAHVVILAVLVVALVCVAGLVIAATYGILHNGNDFDFGNGVTNNSTQGDVIHVRGLLS